ncbi:hypothetical protein CES85_1416 [Ochrobactrum quorumnocens]|uniref:Uncharacterized protein n=1 Tax=Ochrobactrum quorumnocens TaxID=271865 RepID=A0A248UEU6_9HYPH|nr:hypothetical protein CES85_1416 [[Ochrobactrum] quorumnocens]
MEPSALFVICKGDVPLPVDVQDDRTSARRATLPESSLLAVRCDGSANFNVCSRSTFQLFGLHQPDDPKKNGA